jgi:hypothetical protein
LSVSGAATKGERMTTSTPALDPKRTALLVMDFQQGVIDTATLRTLLSP